MNETSLAETLQAMTAKHSDLTLIGNDDVEVRAIRSMLGSRSTVFHRMLYGDSAKVSSDSIALPYSGEVLESLVGYVCTNKAKLLEDNASKQCDDFVIKAVALAEAATFFEFPLLAGIIDKKLSKVFAKEQDESTRTATALEFLRECGPSWMSHQTELSTAEVAALDAVVWKLDDLLSKSNSVQGCRKYPISSMPYHSIEKIIKYDGVFVDEFSLFRLILVWYNGQTTEGMDNSSFEDFKGEAVALSQHINLDGIEPADLSTVVAESGIVSTERLFEAYKNQALCAGKEFSFRRVRQGRLAVWKCSKTTTYKWNGNGNNRLGLLDCPAIRQGTVRTWKIEVEWLRKQLHVGVVSSKHRPDTKKVLGCQAFGWGYAHNGGIYSSSCGGHVKQERGHPQYKQGDAVELTLDLRTGASLSASINGGSPFLLFSNMQALFGKEEIAFIPAVSCGGQFRDGGFESDRVSFLGFS